MKIHPHLPLGHLPYVHCFFVLLPSTASFEPLLPIGLLSSVQPHGFLKVEVQMSGGSCPSSRSTPEQTKPIKSTTWTWTAYLNFLPCLLLAFSSGTLVPFSLQLAICWCSLKSDLRSTCTCIRAYNYVGACDCGIISKTDDTNSQLFAYVRACFSLNSLFTNLSSLKPGLLLNSFLPQCFNQTTDFLPLHFLSCSYL